jgi:hypothetical protein
MRFFCAGLVDVYVNVNGNRIRYVVGVGTPLASVLLASPP